MLEGLGTKHLEHPFIWPETVEFRLYQKRIADVASEGNTLVILPTALGKTVISAMVAANTLYNTGMPRFSSWLRQGPWFCSIETVI